MELSTSSGILLTDQAKELIDELTQLDNNKENIFERLYVMWTSDGVGQITVLKNRFESNRNFISESIVRSFNEKVQRDMRMVKSILDTLKQGENYITPEGNIIFSTQLEIEEWNRMNKINLRKISRRYNKLFEEFVQYIIDRKEPNNSNETKVYKALTKNPTRTNPERDAKGIVDYGKMGNGSGDKKK
jgi:Mor family transcriptional regulator